MLPIDRSDVAATNRRGFRLDQDLAMPRFGDGRVFKFYSTVSGEHRSLLTPNGRTFISLAYAFIGLQSDRGCDQFS